VGTQRVTVLLVATEPTSILLLVRRVVSDDDDRDHTCLVERVEAVGIA